MDISKIKAKIKLPKDQYGKPKEAYEVLTSSGTGWGGANKRVAWSWIIANPVLAIKKDARLAKKTNATPAQIEFIQTTSSKELEKLIEDGKNTSSSRGTKRKAVHSNEAEQGED